MANYELSNRIYELRTQKCLSQKELGAILGVSNKAVSKWETGTAIPKTETLIKLAEVFEISTEELINGVCNDEEKQINSALYGNDGASVKKDVKKSPKEIKKYFFKVSVIFNILLAIVPVLTTIVVFVLEIITSFTGGYLSPDIVSYVIMFWMLFVFTFGHIKLGKYLTEKSGLIGDFNKHKFIYFVVPNSITAFISAISALVLSLGSDYAVDASYWISHGLDFLLSLISIVLTCIVMVVLMSNSIEQNTEKSRESFKTIAIIATVSVLLGYVVDGITDYIQFGAYNCVTPIEDFLFLCINLAIVWLLCSNKERTLKKEKVTFIVLPIISMWGPTVLEILYKISRHI